MALNNRDRVRRALDLLGPALDRFVTSIIGPSLPPSTSWTSLLAAKDSRNGANKTYNPEDPQNGLRMVTESLAGAGWNPAYPFNKNLSRVEQSYAGELREVRNHAIHESAFDNEDAQRALDTSERFLRAIGAPQEAEEVKKMRVDLRRVSTDRYDREVVKTAPVANVGSDNLPPWREVLSPHPDVLNGTLKAAEFAADLYTVSLGTAPAEYADPVQFFRRTYLTNGLRALLTGAAARITGDLNASPVINLQTNFGGGKTHSMLALWHLASGTPISDYPDDVSALLRDYDLTQGSGKVQRVALVGNQLPASGLVKPDGTRVNTIWGELAWQLGGLDAYEIVGDADRTSTNPGAALIELLELYAPAVILIDEWVAYARQLYGQEGLAGGTFDTQFTFAQTLTEAVKSVKGALVVVSIPASHESTGGDSDRTVEEEVGGENGREALRRLQRVVGRTADNWLPAMGDESFEIVRRRLFEAPSGAQIGQISSVAQSVVDYYRKNGASFPKEAITGEYLDKIKHCYPIHPELFDRLYQDWSTLERFQRTRGVLRLMNTIIGSLWDSTDPAALIMPGSVLLENEDVLTELSSYLPDHWKAIVEADVGGPNSVPALVDTDNALFKKRHVAKRLARTIFVGATPTLQSAHKGVDKPRIFLGTALPGDVPGNFHSALDHLANRSTYLYSEGSSYWFDTHQNTTRAARDYADGLNAEDVWAEVTRRLRMARQASTNNSFKAVYVCPDSSADVPDHQEARLVLVPIKYPHNPKSGKDSPALQWATEVVGKRGNSQRIYQNTLIFLAAQERRASEVEASVREFLAWQHVSKSGEQAGLSRQQEKQAVDRMKTADVTVQSRLLETYIWTIYPEASPGHAYTMATLDTKGSTDDVIARAAKKLGDVGALVQQRAAVHVNGVLTGALEKYWKEDGHISLGQLYDNYTTYPFLSRLRDRDVLADGVLSVFDLLLWQQDGFGLADSWDGEKYVGLILPSDQVTPPSTVDSLLIIEPRRAERFRQQEVDDFGDNKDNPDPGPNPRAGSGPGPRPDPDPKNAKPNRYFGSVRLDPDLYARDLNKITQEVISHLAVEGIELDVRIDITARAADGFDDSKVRIIRENANVLNFDESGFEVD